MTQPRIMTQGFLQRPLTRMLSVAISGTALLSTLTIAPQQALAVGGPVGVATSIAISNTTPQTGQGFTLTVSYACASLVSDCAGVFVTATLPSGMNDATNLVGSTHTVSSSFNTTTRVVRFDFVSPLLAGSTGQIAFSTSFVQGPTPNGATAVFNATITSSNVGSATSNNVVATASAIQSWGEQFASASIGFIGFNTQYGFRVVDLLGGSSTNRMNLNDAAVALVVPVNSVFVSATNAGVYNAATRTVSWSITSIVAPGNKSGYVYATVSYPLAAFADGVSVSVTASGTGHVPGTAGPVLVTMQPLTQTHVLHTPAAAITTTKTNTNGSPLPGSNIGYTIVAQNTSAAPIDVTVTDIFPDGTGISPGAAIGIGSTAGLNVIVYYSVAANPRTSPSWIQLGGAGKTYLGVSSSTSTTVPAVLPNGATRVTAVMYDYQGSIVSNAKVQVSNTVLYNGITDLGATIPGGGTLQNCAVSTWTVGTTAYTGSGCTSSTSVAPNPIVTSTTSLCCGTPAPGQSIPWFTQQHVGGNVPVMLTMTDVFPDGMTIAPGGRIGIGDTGSNNGSYAAVPVDIYYSTQRSPRTAPVWNLMATNATGTDQHWSFATAPNPLASNATGITALRYVFKAALAVNRNFNVENDLMFTNQFDSGAPVPVNTNLNNCAVSDYSYQTINNSVTSCAAVAVPAPKLAVQAVNYVWDSTGTGGYPFVNLGGTFTMPLYMFNTSSSWASMTDPVMADVVSAQASPGGSSWATSFVVQTAPGLTFNPATDFSTVALSGNRMALRWQFHGVLAVNTNIQIDLTMRPTNVTYSTNVHNNLFVGATYPMASTCNVPSQASGIPNAVADVDNALGKGVTYASCSARWGHRMNPMAALDSKLLVKGSLDTAPTTYPAQGHTVGGGQADYQLKITNTGTVDIKNVVVYDILPRIGDTAVLDPSALRGSQFSPNLAGLVTTTDPLIKVYYSTATNPCRPEVGISTNCAVPNWTLTFPGGDPTVIRSVKFDFTTLVLPPNQIFQLDWPMRAPLGTPTGLVAWNSVGYAATRADTNATLLPSEPIMTGININPPQPNFVGDKVFSDANNNGIQDVGEGGVNGIPVTLYRASDNAVIDTTISGNDFSGHAGFYQFGNIPNGTYYLIFDLSQLPSVSTVSPKNVGSDPTVDSDADPLTGRTANFTLNGPVADNSRDVGIYLGICDIMC